MGGLWDGSRWDSVAGGAGGVLAALDLLMRTVVAQATILGAVDCPNIVHYLESGRSKRNDVYWFVTELLVGEALDEHLGARGALSEIDAVKVSQSGLSRIPRRPCVIPGGCRSGWTCR